MPVHRPPPASRRARSWCFGAVLAVLALAPPAPAQTPKTDLAANANASAPDTRSLARYVPGDKLVILAEMAGLDAHAEAWSKTATNKMLNETPLGAMLEDLVAQLFELRMSKNARPNRPNGADTATILKHMMRHGFVFAVAGGRAEDRKDSVVLLVFRGGAKKEVRPAFARELFAFAGAVGKPKPVTKRGRTIILMPGNTVPDGWAWWTEQDDLVVVLEGPADSVDVVLDVLHGKRPSAVDHPLRTELAKPEPGFTPVALGFVDSTLWPDPKMNARTAKAGLSGVKRLDYRWGFQDDALMSVARIVAPKPRQGWLALLDQPAFDKKAVPPLPEGTGSFTVLSIDPAKGYDLLSTLTKSLGPMAGPLGAALDTSKTAKGKPNVRKDLLPYLGPKMVFYVAPATAKPGAAAKGEKPEDAAAAGAGGGLAGLNPLALMMGQIPKFTLVAEVNSPTMFGKALDTAVIALNQEMKAEANAKADALEGQGPPGANPNPNSNPPPGAAGDRPRPRGGDAPAPQLKMMPPSGKSKSYMLNIPPEVAKLPPGLKPTIRFEGKYVAISVTPDAARQALEAAAGAAWSPPADLKETFAQLPAKLTVLNVNDPRATLPNALASFPGTLQASINNAIMQSQMRPGGPGGPPGGPPGPFPGGASPTASNSNVPGDRLNASPGSPPQGGSAYGSQPGAPLGGPPGAEPPPAMIQLHVDPAKMPTAAALKPYLFPGSFAVTAEDDSVRFVTRQAFPNFAGWMGSLGMSVAMPAIQQARRAAAAAAGGGGMPGPGGGPGPGSPPGGNPPPRPPR